MNGFEVFTTTLSVSPHKSFEMIRRIGSELEVRYGVSFLAEDFKKGNGFGRSVELARAYGLYRQGYCGCRFSLRDDGDGGGR
jgi:predicted adenine nucleotide alpha hydrolase (AANH) superfamily ATPase